jgi:hypothetical protein
MSTESTTTSTTSDESVKSPVNTAAPIPNKINWRQAAANAGVMAGVLAVVAGGVYAYGKIKS